MLIDNIYEQDFSGDVSQRWKMLIYHIASDNLHVQDKTFWPNLIAGMPRSLLREVSFLVVIVWRSERSLKSFEDHFIRVHILIC